MTFCAIDICSMQLVHPIEIKVGLCVAHLDADRYDISKPLEGVSKGDFVRIRPTDPPTPGAKLDGSRLRLFREHGENAILFEETVLPERVWHANANRVSDQISVTLTETEQRWLRDALTEMLGEIVDVEGLKHEIERLRDHDEAKRVRRLVERARYRITVANTQEAINGKAGAMPFVTERETWRMALRDLGMDLNAESKDKFWYCRAAGCGCAWTRAERPTCPNHGNTVDADPTPPGLSESAKAVGK